MGLFDTPLVEIRQALAQWEGRRLEPMPVEAWIEPGPQVVLREDTGLELGSSSENSLALCPWKEQERPAGESAITLVGPDLPDLGPGPHPLAQLTLASVAPVEEDAYETYRQLREATYGAGNLRGLMARTLPSRQGIWYRVHRESLARGLDARVLGSAIVARATGLPFVHGVEVVLVTAGAEAVAELSHAGAQVLDIGLALAKMHQSELELDCESCEHAAICDAVDELRQMHTRLAEGAPEPEEA